jgi:NADPH:quinone reductase-like Zn-dependent oxidoreductase
MSREENRLPSVDPLIHIETMRIMRFNDSTEAPALIEEEAPQPQPGRGELLIRVHAAGVTPTELLWYPTSHGKSGERRNGSVPGHEFSGVVAALGDGVDGIEVGSEVFGMNDWFSDGATAEYCVTQPSWVAAKPARLTHAEAASVPIGALTAWQGLFDRANLQAGERVLIHGGSGAVGVFAIQLARRRGARVITTASARNLEFLSQLGAVQVVDYRAERFEEKIRDVDVVFDAVGGATLRRSWPVVKAGGRVVTIAADSEGIEDDRVKKAFFIVEPNQKQLSEIGDLLDAGYLRAFVDRAVPFSQASTAYCGEVEQRTGRGKLVITIAE